MPVAEAPVETRELQTGEALERMLNQQQTAFDTTQSAETSYILNPQLSREKLQNPQVDRDIFRTVENLRNEVEAKGAWSKIKAQAKEEIKTLPADILPQLLQRTKPFLDYLPAGHGKAHMARDLIHLSLLYNDPTIRQNFDGVELIAGTLAGIFHDIGNSVQARYDDSKRFAGHAETGAYLFGEVAGDILENTPNLRKLIQYSIAAHTHYKNDEPIKRTIDGIEVEETRRKYENFDTVEGGKDKRAIWLARQTDRLDLLEAPMIIVRHLMTKVVPTIDFSGEEFHEPQANEIDDFKHQFKTEVRTEGKRKSGKTKAERTHNVLEHMKRLSNSALEKNRYTKYDTGYFRNVVQPAHQDLQKFIDVVTRKPVRVLSTEEREESFRRFYEMCRIIEPAKDTEFVIDQFKKKFAHLSETDQDRWAQGFKLLTTTLWQNWYRRMQKALEKTPSVSSDNHSPEQNLANTVHEQAKATIGAFNPALLQEARARTPEAA